jgi:hypothetical protein
VLAEDAIKSALKDWESKKPEKRRLNKATV